MKSKRYLRQVREADMRVNNLISEKEQLATLAECAGAIPISEKVQSSPRADKMENAIIRMVQIEMKLDEKIDSYIYFKHRVIEQLEDIGDERYYNLLYKRYIEYKDFVIIAREMGYEYRSILNLHGKALLSFEKKYLNNQSDDTK